MTWSSTAATPATSPCTSAAAEVIHAPYPGARVRYDPVDMMPINGIVRP